MPGPDLSDLLRMRVASGRARMTDLTHLLPFVARDRAPDFRVRIDLAAGSLTAGGWDDFHDSAADTTGLVEEILAQVMTGLLRGQGLDAGVFDVAERLLAHLTETTAVPGIAVGHTQDLESMDRTHGTVALRFPGARLWDLPILCHEFGHHATVHFRHIQPELADRRPLRELLPRDASERDRRHAEELLADAVATVCAGHTYPVACLCLRVPAAADAGRTTDTHPSWRERVALLRAVLDAMSAHTGRPRYQAAREEEVDPLVRALFGDLPRATERATDLADATVAAIAKHRPELIYRDGDTAIDVAEWLAGRIDRPPAAATPLALLDGAWRRRLAQPSCEPEPLAALVVEYCRANA